MVQHNGQYMKIRDIPDQYVRAGMGVGHWPNHGRSVPLFVDRKFPHTPETCLVDIAETEWVNNGKILICCGCGLDVT